MQQTQKRPTALAIWLVVAGIVGIGAAFALTLEKIAVLEDPTHVAGCDFSILVQCGANLDSAQGSAFGFPNPLIGLVGWMAPVVVGMAILAGARFAKWFWVLFTVGMTFAFGFVCWLIWQSIFFIGTLCPWCMATWVVTIPSFYAVLLHSVRIGAIPLPAGARKAADSLMAWLPLLATVSYVVIAVLAAVRLPLLEQLFG
ncbi:vitamin K epoxide reductase family protein [Microbacterium karelineae]|uniref:vitamin K epoxide reductase family protein n=1 Tax=Microbacterium karelineae TaxID=2654283 RepID=UPI0012E9B200|nr:vitamin K epoxide reductase family protein [Microbacterium karelineae]